MRPLAAILLFARFAGATDVTVGFLYDFTSNTICTATASANCISHFETGALNPAGSAIVAPQTVAVPVASAGQANVAFSAVVPVTGLGTSIGVGVVAVGRAADGSRVESSIAKVFMALTPPPVKKLSAQ